jgi:hypothetical protein
MTMLVLMFMRTQCLSYRNGNSSRLGPRYEDGSGLLRGCHSLDNVGGYDLAIFVSTCHNSLCTLPGFS